MTVVGIIGAGEVGSQIARAAIASGCEVVICNSRSPDTLKELVARRGYELVANLANARRPVVA